MNLSVIKSAVALRYDGAEVWPVDTAGGQYSIVDQSLPVALVHRRLWLMACADPTGTGMPAFRMRCQVEDESGAATDLFDFRIDYKNAIVTPQDVGSGFTGIRPPYAVTNELTNPDRSSAAHSGAGDARVMQFTNTETVTRTLRATMWPVDITARLRRVVWSISEFSIDGGTGGDLTGTLYTGFVMHSQAFPF